jgi:hypothetical protein
MHRKEYSQTKKGRASRREAIFPKKGAMGLFHRNDAFVAKKDLFGEKIPRKRAEKECHLND